MLDLVLLQKSSLRIKQVNKVVNIIDKTGNCVASSLPLAFAMSIKENKIKRDDLIYFVGTGAGLSAASILLTY